MKSPAIALTICLLATSGRAQELPAILYHARENTYGCANPTVTRLLTDAETTRHKTRAWLNETMTRGRCVSITTQSPWKLVELDGDVALMTYAGSVGPPGSYYLRVAEVIDSSGHHPRRDVVKPPDPVKESQTPTKPAQTDSASPTALAPQPDLTPPPDLHPKRPNGVIWVALITALAILAIVAVIALQRRATNRDDHDL